MKGVCACLMLLMAGAVNSQEMFDFQAAAVDYDGHRLDLSGHVEIDHHLGKLKAARAVVTSGTGTKVLMLSQEQL